MAPKPGKIIPRHARRKSYTAFYNSQRGLDNIVVAKESKQELKELIKDELEFKLGRRPTDLELRSWAEQIANGKPYIS